MNKKILIPLVLILIALGTALLFVLQKQSMTRPSAPIAPSDFIPQPAVHINQNAGE